MCSKRMVCRESEQNRFKEHISHNNEKKQIMTTKASLGVCVQGRAELYGSVGNLFFLSVHD